MAKPIDTRHRRSGPAAGGAGVGGASRPGAAARGEDARSLPAGSRAVPPLPDRRISADRAQLEDISALTTADIRAFMAHRRNDGAGARTLGRQIAALRSFARFCEQRGIAATTAFTSIRPPKQPKSLPKALSIDEARDADRHGGSDGGGAVDRGARHSRADAPLRLRAAHLRGAGADARRRADRQRRDASASSAKAGASASCRCCRRCGARSRPISRLCPFVLAPDEPLFRGARGGPLSPRIIQLAMERLRGALGLEDERHAACAAPFLRHASPRARRRSPHHPGAARPRQPVDDADLHERRFRAAARGLSHGASAGLEPEHETMMAVARMALALVLGLGGAQHAAAQARVCSGKSMLREIEQERPEVWQRGAGGIHGDPERRTACCGRSRRPARRLPGCSGRCTSPIGA